MESEKIDPLIEPLAASQSFCFACHPQVPCFNECCRDLNQFLTPYDVLRLKHHFKMSSSEFLATYTTRHTGPQTGLPVVTLVPADRFERICPFVSDAGCRVYENRPSSCRIYPLARVMHRRREDGKKTVQYALLREPHCRGFEQGQTLNADQWMENQGLLPYNRYNDLMMDVISLKNQYMPGPLAFAEQRLFYTLFYDIDALRENKDLPALADIDIPDVAGASDTDLLRFGLDFLKTVITARRPG